MKDGDIAARGLGVGKWPDIAAQVIVDGQREDIGRVPLPAQHPAHPARAKVAFVDLHFACKRPRLCQGQGQNPQAQSIVKTLRAPHA